MQLVISQSAGREAAAAALALLTKSSSTAAACSSIPQSQPALLCLLKHPNPATRLASCICLQNICSAVGADDSSHGSQREVKQRSNNTFDPAADTQRLIPLVLCRRHAYICSMSSDQALVT